ncbi:MAG: DEAD/DEAH box helicase family protein [Christensenellales bacterium]|jgi:superfamily II DNA or RNA helicase
MTQRFTMYDPIDIEASTADSRSLIMPHQQEAVDAMQRYFMLDKEEENRHGMLVMPTGSGKTYTAVTWLLTQGVASGYRVVWLVHRQELVTQAYNEFVKQAPLLKGSGKKRLRVLAISGAHLPMSNAQDADVYVCSIASVANRFGYRFIGRMLGAAGRKKLIVVVDEAHHAVAANYQRVLKQMQKLNSNMVLLGLTATPVRMNQYEEQHLIRQFRIDYNLHYNIGYKGYVYEVTLKQLLLSGFLADPVYEPVKTEIQGEIVYDISPEDEAFFERFGELSERLKNQIARSSARNTVILQQYLNNRKRYGKTLVFAVNQMHAETLNKTFSEAGISCDCAISSKPDAQQVIQRFKDNEFDVLINVQMMTEGSDVPDIQTVFLTRQTNSESLLMQMIGRGLRGVRANGTAKAYIVSFHDDWDRFAYWLDPGALDVFNDYIEEPPIDIDDKVPPIEPNEQEEQSEPDKPFAGQKDTGPTIQDLYRRLYENMRVSLTSQALSFSFPVGWYSLTGNDGEEVSLLVLESQKQAYAFISQNIHRICELTTGTIFLASCFLETDTTPDNQMLTLMTEHILETEEMPPYFEFSQRDSLDPVMLGNIMNQRFEKEEDKIEWLKELYDRTPMLPLIYRHFFAFRKTVFDAVKARTQEDIVIHDERERYQIIEQYHNLEELLKEVQDMFPALHFNRLTRIGWSKRVVKSWFAQCRTDPDHTYYQIQINRMLSSPQIEREIIKYLIFHEALHMNGYWNHDWSFRSREWQYPDAEKLDGILDSLHLKYDMEGIYGTAETKTVVQPAPEQSKPPIFNPGAPGVRHGFKYCRNCANMLPEDAKFCNKCGSNTQY